jgi:membrane-bound metal-dependent hydrolase YbcI (DUF457 family)
MSNFKTHITTSCVVGAGYGVAGSVLLEATLPTCILAGGLCGLAGVLPDLDSDSSVPVRETITFASAVVPMLMIDRFQAMGWSHETIVLAGGILYFGVRFGVSTLIKRYTVHRGMWHSIPAAAVFGLLAFLICSCEDMTFRLFKTGAVVLGFMVHLTLDEIWAIDLKNFRLKKSFGTALKLWGKKGWANVSVYAKLGFLVLLVIGDPIVMDRLGIHDHGVPYVAREVPVTASPNGPSSEDNSAAMTDTPFDPWESLPTFQR